MHSSDSSQKQMCLGLEPSIVRECPPIHVSPIRWLAGRVGGKFSKAGFQRGSHAITGYHRANALPLPCRTVGFWVSSTPERSVQLFKLVREGRDLPGWKRQNFLAEESVFLCKKPTKWLAVCSLSLPGERLFSQHKYNACPWPQSSLNGLELPGVHLAVLQKQ